MQLTGLSNINMQFFSQDQNYFSFHIFVPIAPNNEIDCAIMFNKSSEDYLTYIENRTLLETTHNDRKYVSKFVSLSILEIISSCFQIRRRRYLPADLPKSMSGFHNMFFIRVVSKVCAFGYPLT